jgi:hypothetical protein
MVATRLNLVSKYHHKHNLISTQLGNWVVMIHIYKLLLLFRFIILNILLILHLPPITDSSNYGSRKHRAHLKGKIWR